jgi:hypothetical protein
VIAGEEEDPSIRPCTSPELVHDGFPPIGERIGIVEQVARTEDGVYGVSFREAEDPLEDLDARSGEFLLELVAVFPGGTSRFDEAREAPSKMPIRGVK